MAGQIANYSPEDVDILVAGIFRMGGFVDGAFVNIEKDEPIYRTRVSSDGKATRVVIPNPLYTVRLSLASTSESNQVLTRFVTIDSLTQSGKFPLIIKDRSGGSVFFAAQCWIESQATGVYSNQVEGREWIIKCSDAVFHIGGNLDSDSLTENILNLLVGASPQLSSFLM